ncbi:hypothetical protein [Streptomyces venezuelae]|uniref:hypothetical protein n=1 Tax=Streptomyces venezuelae TaxID=54571 RepID=UPI0009030607|nr:hypothetical protein [Streptomyces venezuelae]APE26752.1 hypothetical protein vnz_37185 [Streptomyces venezuelae]
MPPDRYSRRLTEGLGLELFDRTIPRGSTVKTRITGVFAVNMQLGPLLAAPVTAIALWQGPEFLQTGLAVALFLLGATRRSHLTYRRIRTE